MVQALYNLLPTFENGQSHRRQCSVPGLRLFRQRQTLIRRVAIALVAVSLFCVASLKVLVFHGTQPWSSVPIAPPTPFILKGVPSSHSKLTDASYLAAPFPAPKYRPLCAPISSISSQYASLSASKSNSTIYLALNLLDAQWVLPTFIHELPVLLSYMGSHRFHVSILENGSTDLSAGLLVSLARALAAVGSSYEVSHQSISIRLSMRLNSSPPVTFIDCCSRKRHNFTQRKWASYSRTCSSQKCRLKVSL
jgi:Cryptococcal mannosyltransferase 1